MGLEGPADRRRLRGRGADSVQEPSLSRERPAEVGPQHPAQGPAHRLPGHVDRRAARQLQLPRAGRRHRRPARPEARRRHRAAAVRHHRPATARSTESGEFVREETDVNPGANLHFGFTNLSIDATVNPDFSQVESDAGQVTVNERFALFYAEKRPFFLEGIELFSTPNQLVYTRQIVAPLARRQGHRQVRTPERRLPRPRRTRTGAGGALFNVGARARGPRRATRRSASRSPIAPRRSTSTASRPSIRGSCSRSSTTCRARSAGRGRRSRTHGATRRSGSAEFDRTGRAWGFNYKLTGHRRGLRGARRLRARATTSSSSTRPTGCRGTARAGPSSNSSRRSSGPTRIWRYADFGQRPRQSRATTSVNLMFNCAADGAPEARSRATSCGSTPATTRPTRSDTGRRGRHSSSRGTVRAARRRASR